MNIGDDVLIRLCENLPARAFGSLWRIGVVTDIGFDIIANEPLISLDDDGPPIYAGHIDYVTVLTRAPVTAAWANVFDGD